MFYTRPLLLPDIFIHCMFFQVCVCVCVSLLYYDEWPFLAHSSPHSCRTKWHAACTDQFLLCIQDQVCFKPSSDSGLFWLMLMVWSQQHEVTGMNPCRFITVITAWLFLLVCRCFCFIGNTLYSHLSVKWQWSRCPWCWLYFLLGQSSRYHCFNTSTEGELVLDLGGSNRNNRLMSEELKHIGQSALFPCFIRSIPF